MNGWSWLIIACAAAGISSCGTDSAETATQPQVNPFSPEAIPAALRGGGKPIGGGSTTLPQDLKDDVGVVLNADDLVFTDPDAEDPEDISTELRDLLSAAPTEGPWRKSLSNTFKEARQTGKPVLIWFTDSQFSPNCKMLSEELFSKKEFEEWAQENFVRLQVDQRVEGSKLDNDAASKAAFVKELKKRYKVLGHPTLVVLTPSGEVISSYRGYSRGEAKFKWGQLRQASILARESYANWREKMEKKGYRDWSDPRGRHLFAKLLSYRKGTLILVEPDGNRARTRETSLSQKDRDWIAEQKRLRGIQ
ncbi:thioredoxin family protein [Haloferula sargassicola]|uniref:Thioredoxin domain-containing protein n=1 Tax=Haloferula sargassicola TaxID=490096 RepID=A0ABP9USJ5_9BACT